MKKKLEQIRAEVRKTHSKLCDIIFDEKRGQAGTEKEAALSAAEHDLVDCLDQLNDLIGE